MPAGVVLLCPSTDSAGGMSAPGDGVHPVDGIARAATAYRVDEQDLGGLPPMLIHCARGDAAYAEAAALAQRARMSRVAVTFEEHCTDPHVFQLFWSFLPGAADAMASVSAFIRSLLSGRHRANPGGSAGMAC